MDGLLFYWLFWFGWIITTFFYRKTHPDRLLLSAWILAAITLSTVSINIMGFEIHGTGIFIILSVYIWSAQLSAKKLLYFMLTSFIVMLTSVCFLLFELFDPIWILIKRDWLLAILVACVVVLLHSDKKQRLLVVLLGMIQGEILYAFILTRYSFSYPIASLYALDPLALAAAVLIGWNTLEFVISYVEKNLHSIEKEKEKLT
ncbi:YphA family membrane protein [Niallia endozanthoxylica]|uniref:Uncharacterized protein n=1 Tax=Niallia endozanthoxylica TaxID=2036016 RepID=A0A5J5HUB3_9BACI|nr:hypothetical protein [Niallia endozanthoxylica]KAA9026140.1 hypothetical protein F4V44_09705 [Niallia endozanthoxylica]